MAIETKENLDDDKQWLTYWMAFSLLNFADSVLGFLLRLIPFYQLIKMLVLIWLQNPMTQGAKILYEKYLKPLTIKYKDQIDQVNKFLREIAN